MADSLRDQLIAAGFEAPKKPVNKTAKKGHGKKGRPKPSGQRSPDRNSPDRKSPGHKSPGQKSPGKNATAKTQAKSAAAEAEILARKKLKAQIKTLIDDNKLENWKGEVAYRYTVEKRIRELYVNEAAKKKLTDREVAITRLNGDTYLVPVATADEIVKANPQWSVFNTAADETESSSEDDAYSEFQVPDDLQW